MHLFAFGYYRWSRLLTKSNEIQMKYLTTHITDRADKSQMYYIQLSMLVESANCELRAAGSVQ